jgi:hypothetical protein
MQALYELQTFNREKFSKKVVLIRRLRVDHCKLLPKLREKLGDFEYLMMIYDKIMDEI